MYRIGLTYVTWSLYCHLLSDCGKLVLSVKTKFSDHAIFDQWKRFCYAFHPQFKLNISQNIKDYFTFSRTLEGIEKKINPPFSRYKRLYESLQKTKTFPQSRWMDLVVSSRWKPLKKHRQEGMWRTLPDNSTFS